MDQEASKFNDLVNKEIKCKEKVDPVVNVTNPHMNSVRQ